MSTYIPHLAEGQGEGARSAPVIPSAQRVGNLLEMPDGLRPGHDDDARRSGRYDELGMTMTLVVAEATTS